METRSSLERTQDQPQHGSRTAGLGIHPGNSNSLSADPAPHTTATTTPEANTDSVEDNLPEVFRPFEIQRRGEPRKS